MQCVDSRDRPRPPPVAPVHIAQSWSTGRSGLITRQMPTALPTLRRQCQSPPRAAVSIGQTPSIRTSGARKKCCPARGRGYGQVPLCAGDRSTGRRQGNSMLCPPARCRRLHPGCRGRRGAVPRGGLAGRAEVTPGDLRGKPRWPGGLLRGRQQSCSVVHADQSVPSEDIWTAVLALTTGARAAGSLCSCQSP